RRSKAEALYCRFAILRVATRYAISYSTDQGVPGPARSASFAFPHDGPGLQPALELGTRHPLAVSHARSGTVARLRLQSGTDARPWLAGHAPKSRRRCPLSFSLSS